MYTVQMEHECACFKKSDYTNNSTFNTQQEAYKYANILAELMNEEFCGTHKFYSQKAEGDNFVIRVAINATAVSGCSTGVTCDVGCGSTDEWTLESTDNSGNDNSGNDNSGNDNSGNDSCGTGCGCA